MMHHHYIMLMLEYVYTATDIAKEASDIILLKKSLGVIYNGVIEGRKVYGNIIKNI